MCSFISVSSTGQNNEASECGCSSDTISDKEGSVSDSITCLGGAASELGANVSGFDCDNSDTNGGGAVMVVVMVMMAKKILPQVPSKKK